MNKLLAEHAVWRAYRDALDLAPGERIWGGAGELWDAAGPTPKRALNRRLNPLCARIPRHEPLGAKLLRRIRARPQLARLPAVQVALRVAGGTQ